MNILIKKDKKIIIVNKYLGSSVNRFTNSDEIKNKISFALNILAENKSELTTPKYISM